MPTVGSRGWGHFMRRLKLSIGHKILLIVSLSFSGLVGLAGLSLERMNAGLVEQKRLELRHLAELAISIVKEEHAKVQSAGVSAEEAMRSAAARLANLRYGNGDYFWINDLKPVMIMHPTQPKLNGTDLSQIKDPNGKFLFVEFARTVRSSGSGFVEYEWPKPGADKPQPKLSYVVGFEPWNWVIGTGVYVDDLRSEVWILAQNLLLIGGFIILGVTTATIFLARRISRPIRTIAELLLELANGNKSVHIGYSERTDEVGEAARAAIVFKENLIKVEALEAERQAAERQVAADRKADMKELAERIRASVGTIVEGMSTLSSSVNDATHTMQTNAVQTSDQIAGAMRDLNGCSTEVNAVAAAVTQLAASIREISSQTVHSTRAATDVSASAEVAQQVVNDLTEKSRRIGDVSALINSIAAQTNLLALNATIEAARAGEAGKGFAVVASEVKTLASQTSRATEDIDRQVAEIQKASEDAAAAVNQIAATITSVRETASSIAGAVEEQNAATSEISASVQRAADGTGSVIGNISDLPEKANGMKEAATSLAGLTQELGNQAVMLDTEIDRLLGELTDRREHPRYDAGSELRVTLDGRQMTSRLLDISAGGARLTTVPGVSLHAKLNIVFPDGAALEGEVVWIFKDQLGIRFAGHLSNRTVSSLRVDRTPVAA
jgi:methyl-accepting chemotaxis protein